MAVSLGRCRQEAAHIRGTESWRAGPVTGRTAGERPRWCLPLTSSPSPCLCSQRDPSLCSIKERNPIRVPKVSPTDYSFTWQGQSRTQWRKAVHGLQTDLVWTGRTPRADWANLTHAATSNYLWQKDTFTENYFLLRLQESVFPYLSPQNVPRIWIPITLTI